MNTENINNEFIRLVKILKKSGLTYDAISSGVGINDKKRGNIFRGTSSASEEMIKKLYESFPQLHDINHENPDPPPPITDTIEEMKKTVDILQSQNKRLRIDVNQLRYILDKLIEDLRLLGEVQRIMYEGMQDPEIQDVFKSWPGILARFQSFIALPEEDLPEELNEDDEG